MVQIALLGDRRDPSLRQSGTDRSDGNLSKGANMVAESKDRMVNTRAKVNNDGVKRLPHERDESPDGENPLPRESMKQAAKDLEQGLVDTDLHGVRGVEKVTAAAPKAATPGPKSGANEKAK